MNFPKQKSHLIGSPKVALVLSSGGAKGIAHIGVLEVLHKAKIPIDLIVGCSMGAMIGAFYADGHTPQDILEHAIKIIPQKFFYRSFGLPSFYHGLLGKGFFHTKNFHKILSRELRAKTFEELKIPFQVIATDLHEGTLTTFSEGNLVDHICASIAIPGVFRPVEIGNKEYVDGAVLSETPVIVAKRANPGLIIASNVKGWLKIQKKGEIKNVGLRSYYIMRHHFDRKEEKQADITIRPDLKGLMGFFLVNEKMIKEFYERGKKSAEEKLPYIKEQLAKI